MNVRGCTQELVVALVDDEVFDGLQMATTAQGNPVRNRLLFVCCRTLEDFRVCVSENKPSVVLVGKPEVLSPYDDAEAIAREIVGVVQRSHVISTVALIRPTVFEIRLVCALCRHLNPRVLVTGADGPAEVLEALRSNALSSDSLGIDELLALVRSSDLPFEVKSHFECALIDPVRWSVKRLAGASHLNQRTLERKVAKAGLPKLSALLHTARRSLLETVMRKGIRSDADARTYGWSSKHEAFRAARRYGLRGVSKSVSQNGPSLS